MTLAELVSNRVGLAVDRLLVRWTGYSFVSWAYGRALGTGYLPSLLLATTGAKTGRRRTAVLPYYVDGDRWVIVGSNGGAPTDPSWAVNLRAHPVADIWVGRTHVAVRAYIASGDERARLWQDITKGRGAYARYQRMAQPREIPFVVLERR